MTNATAAEEMFDDPADADTYRFPEWAEVREDGTVVDPGKQSGRPDAQEPTRTDHPTTSDHDEGDRHQGSRVDEDLVAAGHWHELTVESSIDPELVRARGYRTVPIEDRAQLAKHGISRAALTDDSFPGLFIPLYGPTGDQHATVQWKPAQPWTNGDGKPQRYASPARTGNRLDVHPLRRPLLADATIRAWITEGIKKADSLASRGELAIGLTGVWNWRSKAGAVPDWEDVPLRDREVLITYDADAWEKPNVLRAMVRLGAWLQAKGARVCYLIVPAEVNGRKVKGVDDYLAAGGTVDQLIAMATTTPPETLKTDDRFSDSRMAETVADEVLAGRYCWIPALGWLRWDGRRWADCSDKNVGDAVRQWAIERFEEAVNKGRTSGRIDRDEVSGWMTMESAGKQRAVLGLAAGIVERSIDELDGDPDLINTPAGVVDLQTGQLRPHDPDLMMRKITGADYRPGHQHLDWTKILDAIPADVRDWLQLRLGQGLTGHMTPDDRLLVNQGSGENGKTTITDTIGRAMGDYYLLASDRVLLANPDQHPTELMDLQGVRLAVAEETPEARRLSVARLKKTVGTPRINARRIRRDPVTFDATHTFILATNYRPIVEETDRGTWRRLALVRFPFTFKKPGEELTGPLDKPGDPTLRDRARNDPEVLAAALAWMVDGARRWYELGRIMPPLPARVETDTRAWRVESDLVLAYLDDRLRFDDGRHVMAADLLDDLNAWLQARGHRPWSDKTLAARFGDHEEVGRRHVEKRKVRRSDALSRPDVNASHHAYDNPGQKPAPATYWAWLGVRFATPEDLADDEHARQQLAEVLAWLRSLPDRPDDDHDDEEDPT